MLSLGAGSTCDVCLEHFNHEQKAPCSVSCGHVFCLECIHRLTRNTCPLCRAQYDIRSCVKLHVDLESGSPVRASCPTPGEQEARRLQEAITNVANEGSSEPNVRQLIADCRVFLQGHPRTMFPELRVSLRMIAYLYDVKTAYRSQATQLDTLKDQIAQLNLEKAELQRKLEASETGRKDDRELALVVEMNLREHVSRAHAAYETIVE
ncbi:hypothetical protein AMATHDRAFT_76526 [Amanita thiersii Skay4041]|uniref:RING-type domain-containing protein n=1 Tax=Amanita thiersii Skay4041 TaxID=703135 RepID=A0A2A9NM94_9AGAR|nr:hypothetical protein AMATHDRAFT_76526 [Amanita thiersii Skay4041]